MKREIRIVSLILMFVSGLASCTSNSKRMEQRAVRSPVSFLMTVGVTIAGMHYVSVKNPNSDADELVNVTKDSLECAAMGY